MKLFRAGFNRSGRTENVVRNVNIAMICQIVNTLLGFVVRSVFIRMLGETYLGVNGIFSNILTILSFAELGIGTAIVYNLYKPLKEHDEREVTALMRFYRNAYLVIGLVIAVVGLLLTPFLEHLISDQPDIQEDISLLYVLFLSSTVISYYNAHKKSLLNADQKQYVASLYHQAMHFLQIVLQIAVLYLTQNYILYLVVQIVCKFTESLLVARQTDRIYPFLKQRRGEKLSKEKVSSIGKDVGALFLYKINSVIIHGTDNILIAALEKNGVQTVGLYSNYTLISETANMILGIFTNALTPSVGNLNAGEDRKKKEGIFFTILFVSAWLYGYACSGILALSDEFITVWIGKDFVLGQVVVFAVALQLYIRSVHYAAYTYRTTNGLFVQSKYVPILTSLLNIGLSIWWGIEWGLVGILLATSVARILTIGISDPVLVYKHVFEKSPIGYYLRYVGYLLLTAAAFFVSSFILDWIPLSGWLGFIVKFIVYTVLFNGIFALVTVKTKEFRYVWATGIGYVKKVWKRLSKA